MEPTLALVEVEEQEDCDHYDHEDGCCLQCGEMLEMCYKWEHDSCDMER